MKFNAEKAPANGLVAAPAAAWLSPLRALLSDVDVIRLRGSCARRQSRCLGAVYSGIAGQGGSRAKGHALPRVVPVPRPRPPEAPAAEPEQPAAARQTAAPAAERQAARTGRRTRTAAALGLPAGVDGCDRDRSQHSRYPRSWRLRRRGSGAAGSGRAAGQAAGGVEACRHLALRHGIADRRLGPHRHRAAGRQSRQHHQRPRQFRLVRMPRSQPRGRRAIVRTRPRQRA